MVRALAVRARSAPVRDLQQEPQHRADRGAAPLPRHLGALQPSATPTVLLGEHADVADDIMRTLAERGPADDGRLRPPLPCGRLVVGANASRHARSSRRSSSAAALAFPDATATGATTTSSSASCRATSWPAPSRPRLANAPSSAVALPLGRPDHTVGPGRGHRRHRQHRRAPTPDGRAGRARGCSSRSMSRACAALATWSPRRRPLLDTALAGRPPAGEPGAAFIAPLDPLMWDRRLVQRSVRLRLHLGGLRARGTSGAGATTCCPSCSAIASSAASSRGLIAPRARCASWASGGSPASIRAAPKGSCRRCARARRIRPLRRRTTPRVAARDVARRAAVRPPARDVGNMMPRQRPFMNSTIAAVANRQWPPTTFAGAA